MIGILLLASFFFILWVDPKTVRNIILWTLGITSVIYWTLKVFGL